MTHSPPQIAKHLQALHERTAEHHAESEQATKEAKDQLLAKIAERDASEHIEPPASMV